MLSQSQGFFFFLKKKKAKQQKQQQTLQVICIYIMALHFLI